MIEHCSIGVGDLVRACAFYDAVLQPLGYRRVATLSGEGNAHPWASACYGLPGTDPDRDHGLCPFWLEQRPGARAPALPGFHLCFAAPDRSAVADFHAAGLGHGGQDNGAPGLRPHYGPAYYAAFLIDPFGWPIEAVTFSAG